MRVRISERVRVNSSIVAIVIHSPSCKSETFKTRAPYLRFTSILESIRFRFGMDGMEGNGIPPCGLPLILANQSAV